MQKYSKIRELIEYIIREEFETSLQLLYSSSGRKAIDIFKNPTSRELQEIIKYSSVRAFLVGKNICYAWNPYYAIHQDVIDSGVLKLRGKNPLPIELFFGGGNRLFNIRVAVMSAPEKSKWFSQYMKAGTTAKERVFFGTLKKYILSHSYIKGLSNENTQVIFDSMDLDLNGNGEGEREN